MRTPTFRHVNPKVNYSRQKAVDALGISQGTFKKYFLDDSTFVKDGTVTNVLGYESRRKLYSGEKINEQIDKIESLLLI